METSLFPDTWFSSGGSSSGISIRRWFGHKIWYFFVGEDSLRVSSSIRCSFCFLGFFFILAPICLPCFKYGIDSFAAMLTFLSSGISILNGVFTAGIWDLTTFSLLVKTSGNWLQYFVNELSFELQVHIDLSLDQNEMITPGYSK